MYIWNYSYVKEEGIGKERVHCHKPIWTDHELFARRVENVDDIVFYIGS